MNKTLEDYITHEPTLQAAVVRAKFRSNYSQRFYNFDEFKAESRQYICTDMDEDSNPENNKVNYHVPSVKDCNDNMASTNAISPFEEAYLALDLNEEEEFDKWYEQLNSNLMKKQPVVSTKENADSSDDKNMNDNGYLNAENDFFQGTQACNIKINNNLKQSGFDLRQLVGKNKQNAFQLSQSNAQQSRAMAPNGDQPTFFRKNKPKNTNNNNNRRKQKRWSDVKNHFMENNAPYPKRVINGHFESGNINYSNNGNPCVGINNGMRSWPNQNVYSHQPGNGKFVGGPNSDCCSFHTVPMPKNVCQNYCCNRNSVSGLNFNMNGSFPSNILPSGCNSLCYNGAGILNTSLDFTPTYFAGGMGNGGFCGCNHGVNAHDSGTNILSELLNSVGVSDGNSNASNCQLGSEVNKLLNMFGGDGQARHNDNSVNNSKNLKATVDIGSTAQPSMNPRDVNMAGRRKDNNLDSTKVKKAATMLEPNPNEMNFVPALIHLIQFFEKGINIKLSPGNINQVLNLNAEKEADQVQI